MSTFKIQVEALDKSYNLERNANKRLLNYLFPRFFKNSRKFVFRNLNFYIKKGDIVGIIGPNGAGKSTLLKLITGILLPDSGGISVNGSVASILEVSSGLNPYFTGMENIKFKCSLQIMDKKLLLETIDRIVDFCELGDYLNQPVRTYSSGMKSRLGFSIASHVNPDILILDEVLSVGDSYFKRKSFDRIRSMMQGGKTILFVSHNEQQVIDLCNRVILLNKERAEVFENPRDGILVYNKILRHNTTSKSNFYYDKNIVENVKFNLENSKIRMRDRCILYLEIGTVRRFKSSSIGYSVKSESGMVLSGFKTIDKDGELLKGVNYFEISFVNNLLPGNYFISISCSVSDKVSGKQKQIITMFDCCKFESIDLLSLPYQKIGILDSSFKIKKIN